MGSGTGTNLKVRGGRGAAARNESRGHRPGAKCRDNFFGRAPQLFGCRSTISRFRERFRDGQYSLVSFLFAVLFTVPPVPSHL